MNVIVEDSFDTSIQCYEYAWHILVIEPNGFRLNEI